MNRSFDWMKGKQEEKKKKKDDERRKIAQLR